VRRAAAIATVAALVGAATGCFGGSGDRGSGPETLTVYVSVPLHGSRAAEGAAIANGARLALADAGGRVGPLRVRGVYLDDTEGGEWTLAQAGANARRATEDSSSIGYIGDVDSGATKASLPITNQAQLVQISPASTAVDLTRLPAAGGGNPNRYQPDDRTFARVVPDDEVQARAAGLWAQQLGAKQVSVFGDPVADLNQALRHAGTNKLVVSGALGSGGSLPASARSAASLYVTSPYIDPDQLPPKGKGVAAAYGQRFGAPPRPAAAYGYEAMALLLDAIHRAGGDGDSRGAVVDQVLATHDRDSVLGTYSIDGNGDTTLDSLSGYRVSDGLPVSPVKLTAPR
jgi:branched-chain amino acid transport system substrate-binding protein